MNVIKRLIPKPLKKALRKFLTVNIETRRNYMLPASCLERRFDGKVAVVTGGAGGIGRGIALRLAADGATVIICGRTLSKLETVKNEIEVIGGKVDCFVLDVTKLDDVKTAFSKIVEKHGRLDFLVCCAGGGARERAKKFHEQDFSVVDEIVGTNLRGTMLCVHEAAQYMVKRRSGKIITISSIIGLGGKDKYSEYAAAKAGIIGFTKSVAIELAPLGINVNCVSPGKIVRDIQSEASITGQIRCSYVNRAGTPEDVANVVSFLLDDENNFIVGQNICVDGGRTLGLHGD